MTDATPDVSTDAPESTGPRTTDEVLDILRSPARSTELFKGFGPLAVTVVFALAMVLMVPSIAPERIVTSGSGAGPDVPLGSGGTGGTSGGSGSGGSAGGVPGTVPGGGSSGGGTSGGDSTAGGGTSGGGDGGGATGGGASASGVQPCGDRQQQVAGDPYSPPCFAFDGDNGGATAQGVSADEIVVTVRELEGPSAAEIFSDISGESVQDSPESYRNTISALAEYFSDNFQFYGRRLRVEFFDGQGSGLTELLGSGIETALADATRASEFSPFADLSAITIPYADALSQQGVVNFGAPYPSRTWFAERRPYAWSLFPDGTTVAEAGVASTVARLPQGSTAEYAGDSLRSQPRTYGLVAPENAAYQGSIDRYIEATEAAGFSFVVDVRYKVDINSMPNQAANIVAQLKDRGVTTVICACDPVMLALGMAPKANEQNYEPEWRTGGLAFLDQDIVAQLIDNRQWRHAFGTAFNDEPEPIGGSYPYAAYKSVRPQDEPAFGVEELYYQMYLLALGIQLAGPNLTPESFEAGMFSYPRSLGPRGSWGFGPNDYTPTDDFREIWWDPEGRSSQNGEPGTWVSVNGGQRYFVDTITAGPAPFFQRS